MDLPRYLKILTVLIVDAVFIAIAYYCALALRLNDVFVFDWYTRSFGLIVFTIMLGIVLIFAMRLHRVRLSTFDNNAQMHYAIWDILLTFCATFANVIFNFGMPRTVPIIFGILLFTIILGSRYFVLFAFHTLDTFQHKNQKKKRIPIAIYGAGMGGRQLFASLKNSPHFKPVFFVDDNKSFQGTIIGGVRVIKPKHLAERIDACKVEKIFLAMPSISRTRKKTLVASLEKFNCEVKELPSYIELIEAGDVLKSLRPVNTEELLGRDKVEIDLPKITEVYADQNIFVSGAGGSIGSQLCRQVVEIEPKKLILFELTEFALYKIEKELQPIAQQKGIEIIAILGSILDENKLKEIFTEHKINIVLHAAAYKHVPLVEVNEIEAARNNILGTKILATACLTCGVQRFTLISTDKAVRPTNVMGASKRFAELVVQGLSQQKSNTIFSIVRFGNVLGSSGSVIPLFKEQIASGGPITLTNLNITRYFMTIPEAAKLVLIAGTFAEGGEVFVLDMGEPVKIEDLARKMITLSGLTVIDAQNPDGDIAIKVIGLRQGEKLYEELFIGGDILPTPHTKIMRVREKSLPQGEMQKAIATIHDLVFKNEPAEFRTLLTHYIEGYKNHPIEG